MVIYIKDKKYQLNPQDTKLKGLEADVFTVGSDRVVKVFKTKHHPDLHGLPHEQQAAEERIREHQQKLRELPTGLPSNVVTPIDLAQDQTKQRIIGYTMTYIDQSISIGKLADKTYRERTGIGMDRIAPVFLKLWQTVNQLHPRVIIGDFNRYNVLIKQDQPYLIDFDSYQWGQYLSRLFTPEYVDPLLCNPQAKSLELIKPYVSSSDWYAFAILLMESLLYVHPYGGTYQPKHKEQQLLHGMRPLRRITIFDPLVRYPKPAIHFRVLSDELLDYFHQVFIKDKRELFPRSLLENLRWQTCHQCQLTHARSHCPSCSLTPAKAAIRQTIVIKGKVTATQIFRTPGLILYATLEHGVPKWLSYEQDNYRREDGQVVLHGPLQPLRCQISGSKTILGSNNQYVLLSPDAPPERRLVDTYGRQPMFAASRHGLVFLEQGQLLLADHIAPRVIGQTLMNQTRIWLTGKLGFGFYRAGDYQVAFNFDLDGRFNDTIKLPPLRGQLVECSAKISDEQIWCSFTLRTPHGMVRKLYAISITGQLQAEMEHSAGGLEWLDAIEGGCAVGRSLLVPTDQGVVRCEAVGGQINVTASFPETEPFVDRSHLLLAGVGGIYVVSKQAIVKLVIR